MTELRRKVIFLLRGVPHAEELADVLIDVISTAVRRIGGRPTRAEFDVSGNPPQTSTLATLSLNSESVSDQTPEPSKQNLRERVLDEPAGFPEFWHLYPKKVAKADARRAFIRKRPPMVKVRTALAWQRQSRQWVDGFIPHPATWINGEQWDNEPGSLDGAKPSTPGKPGSGAPPVPYCEFHRRAESREKRAPKDVARKLCPECQHTGSLLHPRPPSEASTAGDLLAGMGGGK